MANTGTHEAKKPTNPKQLLIVAALFAVLVSVGVLQFGGLLGGGSASRTNTPQSPPANTDGASAGTQSSQPRSATGIQLPPLSPRDPFRPTVVASTQPKGSNKVVRSGSASRREVAGTPPVPPLTLPGGQFGLQPAEASSPAEPEYPNYRITGVVQGPNSVAIFADSEGRRRFVRQGDLLEEGWRIVSIQRGSITLRKGKRQLTVRVGESTAPNGGNAL
ncbi:MAG: DUF2531 family protein [Fimbriimonadales bacterium]|nr:DUF2531 family protein [Fimbriimonadales bacterium]